MGTQQAELEALGITEDQHREYREAFSIFDTDGDGSITKEELMTVVRSLGSNPSKEEIDKMIKDVDVDGNEQIDFNEFVQLMQKRAKSHYTEEIIKEAFGVMDADGDGYITFPRLKQLVFDLGLDIPDEEVVEMMAEADVDGEGLVRYDALIQLLSYDNENLYEAYKRNESIRQLGDNAGQTRTEQPTHHDANIVQRINTPYNAPDNTPDNTNDNTTDNTPGNMPDNDADGRFDVKAAIEDGKVPDNEILSKQYERQKYDRFSRQPVQKPTIVKVPGQKVPMSKTRRSYLQRNNKALGVDMMTMAGDIDQESNSLKREQRRTMEPWTGSIHDKNTRFSRNFKAKPPEKYKNVNSKLMDDKYFTKQQVPKKNNYTKQVLQQKPVVVEINNGMARCGAARGNKSRTEKTQLSRQKNKGNAQQYSYQKQNQSTPDNLGSISMSNTDTNTPDQYGKQTNVVTTDPNKAMGYMEMINVKTQQRIHYALWRTAFIAAIKKATAKEECPDKPSKSRLSLNNTDIISPAVLTPTLPYPLPRSVITTAHAGSYADSYRKLHNLKADTPMEPVLSPSPKLKRSFAPPKPVLVTKDKMNAMAALYSHFTD